MHFETYQTAWEIDHTINKSSSNKKVTMIVRLIKFDNYCWKTCSLYFFDVLTKPSTLLTFQAPMFELKASAHPNIVVLVQYKQIIEQHGKWQKWQWLWDPWYSYVFWFIYKIRTYKVCSITDIPSTNILIEGRCSFEHWYLYAQVDTKICDWWEDDIQQVFFGLFWIVLTKFVPLLTFQAPMSWLKVLYPNIYSWNVYRYKHVHDCKGEQRRRWLWEDLWSNMT